MVISPRFAHQIQRLQMVHPAEHLVQLRGDEELPVGVAPHRRQEAVTRLGQVQHFVAGRGHTTTISQARVRADEA